MDIRGSQRLLSIQSHVVHGYVGNKAATFPLQCQGWDVDVLNSVNFSNHTGYGSVRGVKVSSDDLKLIYDGLIDIGVKYEAFLTGYVPDANSLRVVGNIGKDLKTENPEALWLLDPVMGDEGELYVSEKVIPIYKEIMHEGFIDVITPNQFEAEILVDFKIDSKESLRKALFELHNNYKIKIVVISSLILDQKNKILSVASFQKGDGSIVSEIFEVPLIESYFTGVGDLFSALLIDRIFRHRLTGQSNYLSTSINEVLTIMNKVLQVTSQAATLALGEAPRSKMGSALTMKECELKVIECRDLYSQVSKDFASFTL